MNTKTSKQTEEKMPGFSPELLDELLGERPHHLHHHPARGCGGINLFGQAPEARPRCSTHRRVDLSHLCDFALTPMYVDTHVR